MMNLHRACLIAAATPEDLRTCWVAVRIGAKRMTQLLLQSHAVVIFRESSHVKGVRRISLKNP